MNRYKWMNEYVNDLKQISYNNNYQYTNIIHSNFKTIKVLRVLAFKALYIIKLFGDQSTHVLKEDREKNSINFLSNLSIIILFGILFVAILICPFWYRKLFHTSCQCIGLISSWQLKQLVNDSSCHLISNTPSYPY